MTIRHPQIKNRIHNRRLAVANQFAIVNQESDNVASNYFVALSARFSAAGATYSLICAIRLDAAGVM